VRSPQYGLYECSDNGQSGGAGYGTATVQPMSMQAEPARPTPYPQPYPAPACAIQVDSDGSFEGKVSPGYAIVEVYYQQYLACTTTTDADGTSTTTCGPDYYPWVQTLSLPADADTALDIVLRMRARPDAVVAGYAVDGSTQKAIPHASVSFTNLDNNAGGMAQTDADGSFKVRLHSGLHRVSVFAEGFLSWEGTLDVPAGETAYDVILTPGHDAYGGCYSYCVMEGKPVPATVAGPYTTTATPSAAPGGGAPSPTGGAPPDGLDSDQKEAGAADNAFQDLGGGLGPYDPVARQKATEAQGKASPHVELAAAVAVLALVALVRRRLPA
jgi:hypothetical protein